MDNQVVDSSVLQEGSSFSSKRLIGNTGWLFADRVVRLAVGLFVNVWVARYLGPSQFGAYNYAVAFVALFSAFATLGLDAIVVRDMVRDPSCRDETLGSAFFLKLSGGALTLAATVAAVSLMRPGDTEARWLVGIVAAGTIFQAFDAVDFWFQAQVRAKLVVYARHAAFLVVAAAKLILIGLKAPLVAFAWAGLAEIVLGAVGLVIAYGISGHKITAWHSTMSRARTLLNDSWPLVFSGLVSMIYLRIDQIMLSDMIGNQGLGVYSAAVQLAEVWNFIPMAIYCSAAPAIVEAKTVSEEQFYGRLQKLYNLMALSGYAIAIPTTFLAGWLVEAVYGPAYQEAGPMLTLLIWSLLFVNLGVARSAFLTTMNWAKVHLATVALGAAVNVVLNLLLIPRFGAMGAVTASCVAYWMAAHGSCFLYRPLFRTGKMLSRALLIPRI